MITCKPPICFQLNKDIWHIPLLRELFHISHQVITAHHNHHRLTPLQCRHNKLTRAILFCLLLQLITMAINDTQYTWYLLFNKMFYLVSKMSNLLSLNQFFEDFENSLLISWYERYKWFKTILTNLSLFFYLYVSLDRKSVV